ncbi:MAG: PKD domain-containing protein [Elusimicrobiota bacterium]
MAVIALFGVTAVRADQLRYEATLGISLSNAYGIAVDGDGNVYSADQSRGVVKFDTDGNVLMRLDSGWGSADVALDSSGNIYVAQEVENRIKKYTSAGTYVTSWQFVPPPAPSQSWHKRPAGVAVSAQGRVYATFSVLHRVQIFDSNGGFIKNVGSHCYMGSPDWPDYITGEPCSDPDEAGPLGLGDGQFAQPIGIAVDSAAGIVYVADRENDRIQKFDLNGDFIGKFPAGPNPHRIAVGPSGDVYVTFPSNYAFRKYSPSGALLGEWGERGSGPGQFWGPTGLAVNTDGVYVQESTRLHLFTTDGEFVREFPSLDDPKSVEIAPGSIYVGLRERVAELDPDGRLLRYIITPGGSSRMAIDTARDRLYVLDDISKEVDVFALGDGAPLFSFGNGVIEPTSFRVGFDVDESDGSIWISEPRAAVVSRFSPDGELLQRFAAPLPLAVGVGPDAAYVVDASNDVIKKFSKSGQLLGQSAGSYKDPFGISVGMDGKIYLAASFQHQVVIFDSDLNVVETIGTGRGSGDNQFDYPNEAQVGADGRVYVADNHNHRVQVFAPPVTNRPPVAEAGPDQTALVGESVHFDGSGSSDPDGSIVSYEWDFGDGSENAAGANVSHPYSQAGIFTVTLTVTDDQGDTGTDTALATAQDFCPDDPDKVEPGVCGCGVPDTDSDGDGTLDCNDGCPYDAGKTQPGVCGCGVIDDGDGDGAIACVDDCDDSNPDIRPGAEETCYDALDNDCDGAIDEGCAPGQGPDGQGPAGPDGQGPPGIKRAPGPDGEGPPGLNIQPPGRTGSAPPGKSKKG